MDHREYIRFVTGADTAVLMIHGVNNTPRHFDRLVSRIPDNVTVCNILLKGHGGTVRDFSKATMRDWHEQVSGWLTRLSDTHRRVIVVGYSLGSLLTLANIGRFQAVSGLLLLNPPLYPKVTPSILWSNLKACFGIVNRADPVEAARYDSIGTAMEPWLWKYLLWIPNLLSLVRLASHCRPLAAACGRCYVLVSAKDELVKPRSRTCFEANPQADIRVFENSGHCYYEPAFWEHAEACLDALLKAEE